VHEWGTFTSVAAEDGTAVEWVPQQGPRDLPCFVESYKNRLIKTIEPEDTRPELEAGTQTIYNSIGRIEKTIDLLGNPTIQLYNHRGEVIRTTHPDESITLSATVFGYPVPGGQPAPNGQGRATITTQRHIPGAVVFGTRTVYDEAGRAVRTERLKNVLINIVPQGAAFALHQSPAKL
jgi:hypothetical protein